VKHADLLVYGPVQCLSTCSPRDVHKWWLHTAYTSPRDGNGQRSKALNCLVGGGRFELPTNGLKVRCSTG
jgi:hypothetical protein